MPQLFCKDIGPAAVVFDYGDKGSGTVYENLELICTLGTTSLKIEDQTADVYEEAYGDAPVDSVFKGSVAILEVPLTRESLTNLNKLFPVMSSLTGDVLTWKSPVGQAMRENAVAIVIKPIVNNVVSTVDGEWILIYLAHPIKTWDIGFDREGQRMLVVQFKIFPKQAGEAGDLFQLGVDE